MCQVYVLSESFGWEGKKREHFFIELIKPRRLCVMDMILSNVLLIEKCTFLRHTDEIPDVLSLSVCSE